MLKSSAKLLAIALAIASPLFAESKFESAVPVRTVRPEYPEQLKAENIAGVVEIRCTVDVQGNVVSPEVQKSTNEGFNKAALDAVRKWKFKPAQQDGTPVAKPVIIPIRFTVD